MSAAATSATGVSSGRLDMLGGVADYSGSTVLEVATRVTTTANAKLVADSGDKGFAVLRSTPFGECKLPLDGLRDTTKIDHAAVRATLKDAGAPLWAHYVFGCVAVFAKHTGWLPAADAALEVDIHSDVPTAQGCSSSASVECATLRALRALSGASATNVQLAHWGQEAENHVVGAPCGLMDQLASMMGQPGKVLPILCRPDITVEPLALSPGVRLVGWPSGVKHSVGASPYGVARTATFMGKKIAETIIGRPLEFATELRPSEFYREVLPKMPRTITGKDFLAAYGGVDDALSSVEPDREYAVADSVRFPIEENGRCILARTLLATIQGKSLTDAETIAVLAQIGELMLQSHAGYTAIGLGSPETDTMIRELCKMIPSMGGVIGARISGGGSGGTVVVLCFEDKIPAIEALAKELTFGEAFPGLIM